MKKYGLITIHRAINNGAVLQALATQNAFLKYECEVNIINYMPKFIRDDNCSIRKNRGLCVSILDFILQRKRKVLKFNKFIERNLKLTEEVCDLKEIEKITKSYDGFISGSDQIWNPRITGGNIDKAYLCGFAKEGQNVFSYASSLGDKICFDEKSEKVFQEEIKKYSSISVREKSGAEWIKNHLNLNAEIVTDPTLLLSKNEWCSIIEQSNLKIKKPYIFVYSVGRTKDLINYAKKVQKVLKMDIVVLNTPLKYPFRKVKYIMNDSPEDFLYLISNASCVITSSFHGTIFSANFNIPFLSFPVGKEVVTRSSEFLKLINISKQFIPYEKQFSQSMLKIDWDLVNNKIDELRNSSYRFIEKCIRGNHDKF